MSEMQVGLLSLSFSGLGLFIGAVATNVYYHGRLTPAVRKALRYTRALLDNYHAAHKSSPLTEIETEEILRLCKAELDKVLED